MNIFFASVFLLSTLFIRNFGFFSFSSKAEEIKVPTKTISVLLHQLQQGSTITLSSEKGFIVKEKRTSKQQHFGPSLTITYKKGSIFVNGRPYNQQLIIQSANAITEFNKKQYQGSFTITQAEQKAFLINEINLEDYVYSVLKTESWPGWPLEINKILATVCRTYALAMIENAEKAKRPYHVTNTNLFQTYRGIHTNSTIRKAVDETKGLIICYGKKPILAMYDSCCGGITPAQVSTFDFSKKPYLARTYPCTYCKNCSLYKWQTAIPIAQLAKHINSKATSIESIKVTKKDKAGIAQEIALKGNGLSTTVTGQKIYSLSKDIKSFHFDAYRKSNAIIFFGRGYGHHIGLCQWGAYEMIKKGYGFEKILKYYYPGTSLGKII